MPYYLLQAAYSRDALAALVANPLEDTTDHTVRPSVEKVGGTMGDSWLSFGDYDVVAILNMPDNKSAVAASVALGAGGIFKAVKTTPLIKIPDESNQALQLASGGR